MKRELGILYLEDVPADVMKVNHELRRAGLPFRTKRVDSKVAFLQQLVQDPPDLILCDHGLPSLDGFTALAIARDRCPEVPVIFITCPLGEQVVVETFESGASAYVLKTNLGTLGPTVQRALREAEANKNRRHEERVLHKSEELYRMLVEAVTDYAIFMLDKSGCVTSWNPGAEWIYGYRADEVIGQNWSLFYPEDQCRSGQPVLDLRTVSAEGRLEQEGLRLGKGGKRFWAHAIITTLRDANGILRGYAQVIRDITKQKRP